MQRSFTTSSALARLGRSARRVAATVAEGLDLMFNAGPQRAELRHLATVSDSRLAARGLTRQGELTRILGRR